MFEIANTAEYYGTVFLRVFLRILQFSCYLQSYYILAPLLKRDAETKVFDAVRMRLYTCARTFTKLTCAR